METMEKVQERIQKLFRLSSSPNENEAQEALLKAQELMAKHNLTRQELGEKPSSRVVELRTDITYTARSSFWMVMLSQVIASNHCCKLFQSHFKGKQTYQIAFCGMQEDAATCAALLRYAVDTVTVHIQKRTRDIPDAQKRRAAANSYAVGFVEGLAAQYKKQKEAHAEYAMVLLVPKAVEDHMAAKKLQKKAGPQLSFSSNQGYYMAGYADGAQFHTDDILPENADAFRQDRSS